MVHLVGCLSSTFKTNFVKYLAPAIVDAWDGVGILYGVQFYLSVINSEVNKVILIQNDDYAGTERAIELQIAHIPIISLRCSLTS